MALSTPGKERGRGRGELGGRTNLSAISQDGVLVWEQPGLRIMIGWSGLVLAMVMLSGAWFLRTRPANGDLPGLALLFLLIAASGSTFQAGVHWFFCRLQNFFPCCLVLTAVGYRSKLDKTATFGTAVDGEWNRGAAASRLEIVAVPSLLLGAGAVIVGAIHFWWTGPVTDGIGLVSTGPGGFDGGGIYESPLKVAAWTWAIQVTWMLLPIPGSQGRAILEAVCGLATTRSSSLEIQQRANGCQGLVGIAVVVSGLFVWRAESQWYTIPAWPLIVILGLLIWSGRRSGDLNAVDRTSAHLDSELPTQDGRSRTPIKSKRSFTATMLGRWRIRRAIKVERGEASDERNLDTVLEKLHTRGHESLSAAERNLLSRVSRRLRNEKR